MSRIPPRPPPPAGGTVPLENTSLRVKVAVPATEHDTRRLGGAGTLGGREGAERGSGLLLKLEKRRDPER